MDFWRGLLAARSHLAFLLGVLLAGALIAAMSRRGPEDGGPSQQRSFEQLLDVGDQPPLAPTGKPPTEQELQWARVAWKYFENNYQAETGLVNSNDKFPSTTLWDLGSYVMGLLGANALGIVDEAQTRARLELLLATLARVPLTGPGLPNKAYNTQTLQMVNYNNEPVPGGIGWSAIDIARIGVPFSIVVWRFPDLTPRVRAVVGRWNLGAVSAEGEMIGSEPAPDGSLRTFQEGRFGYEQYAAKSLFLLGLDMSRALSYRANVDITDVEGQPIAFDRRLPRTHGGTHNAVLSEPYILDGVEFGFDAESLPVARAVLLAQMERARRTGQLTAVSEDNLDRPPFFVYNSVLNDLEPWAAFTPTGEDASAHRTISLKAAVGLAFLFDGEYSQQLLARVADAHDPERGWYSGIYEGSGELNKALSANTNGIVLEVLAYRARGPWLPGARRE